MNYEIKEILGILDTYHDFEIELNIDYFDKFKDFCINKITYTNALIEKYSYIFLKNTETSEKNKIKKSKKKYTSKSINEYKIFDDFLLFCKDNKNVQTKKSINLIEKNIISNFKTIFGNIQLLDQEIISYRIPLYTLIYNIQNNIKYDDIIIFFINSLELKIDKNIIIKNCELITENLTYPLIFTSDMTIKPEQYNKLHIDKYNYQIINLDKKNVDGAYVTSVPKKVYNLHNCIQVYQDNINKIGPLTFCLPDNKNDTLINFMNAKYYYYNNI